MHKYPRSITGAFTSTEYFSDVNLRSALFKAKATAASTKDAHADADADADAVKLEVYPAPGLERISFTAALSGTYTPTDIGARFGPSWKTFWVRVTCTVPDSPVWAGQEVWFVWDAECEGLVWTQDGTPIKGLTGGTWVDRRAEYVLTKNAKAGEKFTFYIELACNGMFGVGRAGMINPVDPDRFFNLAQAEIAVPNKDAWALYRDFEIVLGMAKELPADSDRGAKALVVANDIVNTFRHDDLSTIAPCRALASRFLSAHNGDATHRVTAIGHCHIDTAWLWPYAETKRKVARSWAAQVELMEQYPNFMFTASQMQQWEWLKDLYPTLWPRVMRYVKEGRFVPIGGTWVEMDCNVPSGESFVRQFLYGQRFMRKEFDGMQSEVFWLPDTFGYSAQLPQIVKHMGGKYFFTQKLSWNNINKFPHTTFWWAALDGTKVLTHFCPADTYCSQADVKDVTFSVKNNKDLATTSESLLLFGNGDGGGGPNAAMVERLERMADVAGLPKVEFGSPNEFYARLEESSRNLTVWKGELYFELHRGTYTTHASTKRNNRKCEYLLRDVEYFGSLASALGQTKVHDWSYPKETLDRLWKMVLLNQFHDVLPGSSITEVYKDTEGMYKEIREIGTKLFDESVLQFFDVLGTPANESAGATSISVHNTTCWPRSELVEVPLSPLAASVKDKMVQKSADGKTGLVFVPDIPSFGHRTVRLSELPPIPMRATAKKSPDGSYYLENDHLHVSVNAQGRITALIHKRTGRNAVPSGALGNVFRIYEDVPLFWDAWDVEVYHLEKSWEATTGEVTIAEEGPVRAVLAVRYPITPTSVLTQKIVLSAQSQIVEFDTEVDWHENRKFLKVEFTFDVMSDVATYETAFGSLQRPSHFNTSWDMAKFEVCGHKFGDLSEFGFGCAILNDCKYGYATRGNTMTLSLIRSPKAPDDTCDMGHHKLRYAVYPHKGSFSESDVVKMGYQYNVPVIARGTAESPELSRSFFEIDSPNVVLDTIKLSEDDQGSIILRLYDGYGGHSRVTLKTTLPLVEIHRVNGLEDEEQGVAFRSEGGVTSFVVDIRTFEIVSLKLKLSPNDDWERVDSKREASE
ncbi:glycoside hydrolase family 38 protein [Gonapodya prolifera JEL478]|uniref:Alpha-mannosidase n=1 Tax=Gonapodya prolifera (strain JEL478) TaxID=1344416 RepID=A0A139A543_GONPJ|nr:glycoside hydrolase family 38 protein [Gonapodya prolifera JEL478]|eukprot:KXS11926.1 glycoside hydrolase family 38 protein [Gonapodya prolifera JEL478]